MSIHKHGSDARGAANISSGVNGVWETCPRLEIMLNPLKGFRFFDDFTAGMNDGSTGTTVGGWRFTQAGSAGTFLVTDEVGGVALLDSADDDNGDGGQIQTGTDTGEIFLPAADKDLWFEARVAVDIITDDFFIGLSEYDTSIITTSGVTPSNFIGFSSITGDGVLLANSEKADTGSTGTGTTFEDGTYVRLGFVVTTTPAGALQVTYYVDGVAVSGLAATYVPIVEMMPSFVCQSGGTAAPIMSIDWVDCVQLR